MQAQSALAARPVRAQSALAARPRSTPRARATHGEPSLFMEMYEYCMQCMKWQHQLPNPLYFHPCIHCRPDAGLGKARKTLVAMRFAICVVFVQIEAEAVDGISEG